MMETQQTHARGGWHDDEINVLFQAVQAAAQDGRPLRDVFADVASTLKRKPNSIRNFYYARVRELPDIEARKAPFRTFTQEELRHLLRTVLMARGGGESVRACVTRMAEGDRGRMLRYQNKYRSILKNRPEMLEAVAQELRAEGLPCPAYVTCHRHMAEDENLLTESFEEASRLSRALGDDSLALMVERLYGLLRRASEAENRLMALEEEAGQRAGNPTADLAITLTDLRGPDSGLQEDLMGSDAVPYQKWADTRREADRLRVQLDLLKLHLEDTLLKRQRAFQPLGELLRAFFVLPAKERARGLDRFVAQARAALEEMEGLEEMERA